MSTPRNNARTAAAPTAPAANALTSDLFMSSTLGTQSGAEAMSFGLYKLVPGADGRPELSGATYNAEGKIERELYEAPGQSYDGKPRAAYFIAQHVDSGNEFRLSAKAVQDAIKASSTTDEPVTIEDVIEGIELQQTVKENANGYRVAAVSFEPGE